MASDLKPLTGCELVRQQVSQWSDWDADTMVAISMAEANCSADARGDGSLTFQKNGREYGYSAGALQVRILPGREHCENQENYYECAHAIWQSQGYEAWSVFSSGKYTKYLN